LGGEGSSGLKEKDQAERTMQGGQKGRDRFMFKEPFEFGRGVKEGGKNRL